MNSGAKKRDSDRAGCTGYVADHLLLHAGALTRLLAREAPCEMTRTEAGVLFTLSRGPRRITELAELEGLAQPTVTLLVKKLEQRGLVERDRHTSDGRVVVLSLTKAGEAALEDFRARLSAALRRGMDSMSDREIAELHAATEALGTFVDVLAQPPGAPVPSAARSSTG
jgi:DNA-binding MarR family transcriptional regulator